jgi:hypothetical protein
LALRHGKSRKLLSVAMTPFDVIRQTIASEVDVPLLGQRAGA